MGLFGRERIEGKSPEQLQKMRVAGLLVGRTLELLAREVRPGMTTLDLDTLAETHIRDHGGIPNFQLVPGYRHTLCTSVNEVICHGIPGEYELRDGDIVNVDVTTKVDGWHGDQSETFLIGAVTDEARAVTQCAFDCLHLAIQAIRPWSRISEIGDAIVNRMAYRRG